MMVQFSLNLAEFRRSCRRIATRLPDEEPQGGEFVKFVARSDQLVMSTAQTIEELEADIL